MRASTLVNIDRKVGDLIEVFGHECQITALRPAAAPLGGVSTRTQWASFEPLTCSTRHLLGIPFGSEMT